MSTNDKRNVRTRYVHMEEGEEIVIIPPSPKQTPRGTIGVLQVGGLWDVGVQFIDWALNAETDAAA